MFTETIKEGKNKYRLVFKKSKTYTLIENGEFKHYIKLTFLDGSTAVYDNQFNLIMSSYKEATND